MCSARRAESAVLGRNILPAGSDYQSTERTWYYDLSDLKVTKTKPFTLDRMEDFFERLPKRDTAKGDSERSWWVDRATIEQRNYDLKAVNPNRKAEVDSRTPADLLDEIEAKGREADEAVASLRKLVATIVS